MEAAKKGFSIDAAVKRSGSEPAGGSARKVVPKVSKTADENSCGTPSPPAPVSLRQGTSLGRMELEPAKRQNTPRAQTNAPVNIAVCPLGGGAVQRLHRSLLLASRYRVEGECSRSPPPGDSVPYRALFWTPRYKVTDASGDVWAAFPDTKLWQIQAPF